MPRVARSVTFLTGICVAATMIAYYSYAPQNNRSPKYISTLLHLNGTKDFLINTPGCTIPNYAKTLTFYEVEKAKETCGERAVFVKKITDEKVAFTIDKNKFIKVYKNKGRFSCCYRFARRSDNAGEENNKLIHTPCIPIQNNTTAELLHEVITVECVNKKQKTIYEDSYIVLKKLSETPQRRTHGKSWNVLLVGLDTMSRARAYFSLPRTVKYLKENDWLDYRGYQKVASNTYPNLMALLAGKNAPTAYSKCQRNMEACNHLMMWSKFKEAGYVTAYGEDYLSMPDTFAKFGGFTTPPTDHYMRPFFLTGETQRGNFECTAKMSSAVNVLNYAHDFVSSYRNESFFGFFWINSCSHNLHNSPTLYESDFLSFFDRLNSTGVLQNTFIIFLSDHGIRFGRTREDKGSFFEERLPMLFIWVPIEFRNLHVQEFQNLKTNEHRLVTPYNLYATFGNLLQMATNSNEEYRPEACDKCFSLFKEVDSNRNCLDVAVDEKWCTCHGGMSDSISSDESADRSLKIGVEYVQNKAKNIETAECTTCSRLSLKSVLRSQWYRNSINNNTYYVIAFVMTPGDMGYEVSVEKHADEYTILQPTDTISKYNVKGSCAINPNNRPYCVCKSVRCKN